MSDEKISQQNTPSQSPRFAVQRIYIKDSSFETPMGIKIFQQSWKPRIQQEMRTLSSKLSEDIFEVVLTVTVTLKLGEQENPETALIAEVQQAGIFQIYFDNEDSIKRQLAVICPSILFPYAREAIDNLVTKGSLPALMLPPVNFQALYENGLAQQNQAGSTAI